jgi:hypothetical protein
MVASPVFEVMIALFDRKGNINPAKCEVWSAEISTQGEPVQTIFALALSREEKWKRC